METTSISRKPAVKPGWGRWQSWQSEEADSRETLRMRGVRRGSHRIQKKKKKKRPRNNKTLFSNPMYQ